MNFRNTDFRDSLMEIHAHKNNNIGGFPNSPLASTQIFLWKYNFLTFSQRKHNIHNLLVIFLTKLSNEASTVAASKEK